MSTRDDLLDAVRADPEADAPRLVFADFLDEDGEPERAELIRVQCKLARLPWDDFRLSRGLARRAAELVAAHGARWLEGATTGVVGARLRGWERGFPETLVLDSAAGLGAACAAQVTPVVRLAFDGARLSGPALARLARSPLGAVRRAAFEGDQLADRTLLSFAESAWGQETRELTFEAEGAPERLVRFWAAGGHAPKASVWRWVWGAFGAEAMRDLGGLPTPLEGLDVSHCAFADEGWPGLLALPASARLRALHISSLVPADFAARALRRCPALEWLTFDGMFNPVAFADALAHGAGALSLRFLTLDHVYDCDAAVAALAALPRLSGLRHLRLNLSQISPEAVDALARSDTLDRRLVLEPGPHAPPELLARLRERFTVWD